MRARHVPAPEAGSWSVGPAYCGRRVTWRDVDRTRAAYRNPLNRVGACRDCLERHARQLDAEGARSYLPAVMPASLTEIEAARARAREERDLDVLEVSPSVLAAAAALIREARDVFSGGPEDDDDPSSDWLRRARETLPLLESVTGE